MLQLHRDIVLDLILAGAHKCALVYRSVQHLRVLLVTVILLGSYQWRRFLFIGMFGQYPGLDLPCLQIPLFTLHVHDEVYSQRTSVLLV